MLGMGLRVVWGPDSAAGRWGESGGEERGLGLVGWAVTGKRLRPGLGAGIDRRSLVGRRGG